MALRLPSISTPSGPPAKTGRPWDPPTVDESSELERVLAVPRRVPPANDEQEALAEKWTRILGLGPKSCSCALRERPCILQLLPIQGWVLEEASRGGGVLGFVGVGAGKTIVDFLVALAMPGVKTVLLLVPPGLLRQLLAEYDHVADHFKVPTLVMPDGTTRYVPGAPCVRVVPYSRLSRPESTAMIRAIRPCAVVADEVQKLRHLDSAGTRRVARWFVEAPSTRFLGWSGSLEGDAPVAFGHLAAWSLGTNSPLPLERPDLEQWSAAIAPRGEESALPGPLSRLCAPGETLEQGFRRRLRETPGVVSTTTTSCRASTYLHEFEVELPRGLAGVLAEVRRTWVRPDHLAPGAPPGTQGEELVDALTVARVLRELACGFFYRWKFPRGEPEPLIREWFEARKLWNRELRQKLMGAEEHLDSPHLCERAAVRHYQGYRGDLPTWGAATWPRWAAVKCEVEPESEAVWLDDFLARAAAEWARQNRGVVWYESTTLGKLVGDLAGVPVHGGGPGAEARILAERGKTSICASISSHGTGRNGLQRYFSDQCVLEPPSSGEGWQQLLGRLSRPEQRSDEVRAWVPRHTPEVRDALDAATRKARYAAGVTGGDQLLLLAARDF